MSQHFVNEPLRHPRNGLLSVWEALSRDITGDAEIGKESPFQPFRMWKIVDGKYVRHIKKDGIWVIEQK